MQAVIDPFATGVARFTHEKKEASSLASKRLEQQIQQIVAQEVAKVFSGSGQDNQGNQAGGSAASGSGQQTGGRQALNQPLARQATQAGYAQKPNSGTGGKNAATPTSQTIRRVVAQTVSPLVPGGGSGGNNQNGGSSGVGAADASLGSGVAVHAAQVLGKAEMELSNELSANLQKLKAVIQDSQRIAQKIETVLGKG